MADDGEDHETEPVPEHRGVERQMQGGTTVLPLLHRLQHKGSRDRSACCRANSGSGAASWPVGRESVE